MLFFCEKVLTPVKLRVSWYYILYMQKLLMCVYLHTKFQVFSIILMRFRRVILPLPPLQNEPLKTPPRLRLT